MAASDFSELEPAGMASPDASLQQRKSSETRIVLLEAALDCLAQVGYARTTTELIVKTAKASRGAMLHHYATKQDLIASAIDYAFFRHMESFSRAVRSLSEIERTHHNAGILVDWSLYLSREYKAYLELNVAARTDDELRAIFIPKAQRHERVWNEELLRHFPEWGGDVERLTQSHRLVQAIMSGMVLNRDVWNDPQMEATLLTFVASMLLKIRDGSLQFSAPPPPKRRGRPRKAKVTPTP